MRVMEREVPLLKLLEDGGVATTFDGPERKIEMQRARARERVCVCM